MIFKRGSVSLIRVCTREEKIKVKYIEIGRLGVERIVESWEINFAVSAISFLLWKRKLFLRILRMDVLYFSFFLPNSNSTFSLKDRKESNVNEN